MYMHAKKSFAFENTRYQLLQLHYLVKTAWGGGGVAGVGWTIWLDLSLGCKSEF